MTTSKYTPFALTERIAQLGQYLVLNPGRAALLACAAALLPIVSIFSQILVGFMTLSCGRWAGLKMVLWALIPAIALAAMGAVEPLFYLTSMNLSIWLIACLFLQLKSWSQLIEVLFAVGVLLVLSLHLLLPDITHFWLQWLHHSLVQWQQVVTADVQVALQSLDTRLPLFAKIFTGFMICTFFMLGLGYFFVARAWQLAALPQSHGNDPHPLRRECHQIRISRVISVMLLIALLVGYWGGVVFLIDCVPVILLPFFIAGLSFVHCFFVHKRAGYVTIALLYAAMVLFFPYIAATLMVIGLIDCWCDLRQRLSIDAVFQA